MSKLLKNRVKSPYVGKDGRQFPGVTTVIGVLDKPALKQWAWSQGRAGIPLYKATEGALSIGTVTHYLSECFVKGVVYELDPEFDSKIVEKSLILAELFSGYWIKSGAKLLHSEVQLIDEMNGFGGTLDLIVDTPTGKELWDIKTSDKIWPEYYIQLAAYRWLAKLKLELDLTPRIVLITKSEKLSAPDIPCQVIDKAFEVWESLLRVYYGMNEMKGMFN